MLLPRCFRQIRFPGALAALALPFLACDKVDYRPVSPSETVLTVHHMGAYSSQMAEEDKEVQGTLFQTRWKLRYGKRGDGWLVQRRLDTMNARGYHKNSMPNELEKKASLDIELGPDGVPRRVTGYDSLPALLGRIEQRDGYRRELLRMIDTLKLQAEQRDVFRLRRLLPTGVLKRGAGLEVGKINKNLETLQLDSARYQGDRPRLSLRCLEYETYYHRADSLPLLVEQFFFSSSRHRKWRHSTWVPGRVEGIWHFSVERKTGLPCFESLTETGRITLKDTGEKSEELISLFRYEEDIYNR